MEAVGFSRNLSGNLNRLYDITTQNIPHFMVTVVRTPIPRVEEKLSL
jgi:hypothetical protein